MPWYNITMIDSQEWTNMDLELKMFVGYLRNIRELCDRLEIPYEKIEDVPMETVILKAWRRWGTDTGSHFFGAFSIAVFDKRNGTLYCIRDQLGMEQLYYCISAQGNLLYASDIETIRDDPQYVPSINREALQLYVMFGYPAGEQTLYQGIKKLPPGCCLIFSGAAVHIRAYFSPRFSPRYDITEDYFCDLIEETAGRLIEEDLSVIGSRSVVSFLSGGVDSSWLLALCGADKAIGIGYEKGYADETGYAAGTASVLGREFKKETITPQAFFDAVPELVRGLELPLADASAPAFFLGCQAASRKCSLCYSGEGPDEFFAGYRLHRRAQALSVDGGSPYFGCFGLMSEEAAVCLLGYDQSRFHGADLTSRINKETVGDEHLSRILAIDIGLFFEGDILLNLTRSAKANGLNIRAPFSDPRMFQVSSIIPSELKLKDQCGKYIFRKAAARKIPYETAFREKTGFAVPVSEWMRIDAIRSGIESVLFSSCSELFFDQALLHKWWQGFLSGNKVLWNMLYGVYVFLIWYDSCFIKDNISK